MISPNNPAGRLYLIVDAARSRRNGTNTPLRAVWAHALGVSADNPAAIFVGVAQLQALTSRVRGAVVGAGLPEALYLRNFAQIEQLVATTNLDVPWHSGGPSARTGDVVMTELMFCAQRLAEAADEDVVADDELAQFARVVDKLADRVRRGSLAPEMKATLLDLLEAMRHAVARYRTRGAEAFRDALATSLGTIVMEQRRFEAAKDAPEVSRYKTLLRWVMKHAGKARPALETVKLAAEVRALVESGGPPPAL